MSEENMAGKPEGKGLAIGGFVLSLVGLIFSSWIFAINVASMGATLATTGELGGSGLMIFWLILCLASVVLSVMGMMKLGKTGGKKGLGIAGMIIGIVAVIWSLMLLMGLSAAAEMANIGMSEGFEQLENMDADDWNDLLDEANEDEH